MTFIVHSRLGRRIHHPHIAGAGFHDRPVPRRPHLVARWVHGADGKLECRWHPISST